MRDRDILILPIPPAPTHPEIGPARASSPNHRPQPGVLPAGMTSSTATTFAPDDAGADPAGLVEGLVECPYVNRADGRCASHLNVSDLHFAFDHCFDRFESCPVYAEISAERDRQIAAAAATVEAGSDRPTVSVAPGLNRWKRLSSRLVQLTCRRRRVG